MAFSETEEKVKIVESISVQIEAVVLREPDLGGPKVDRRQKIIIFNDLIGPIETHGYSYVGT